MGAILDSDMVTAYPKVRAALERGIETATDLLKTQICFVAGTPVHTPVGLRPIESLKPGDLVLTMPDSASDGRADVVSRRVLQTFQTFPNLLLEITFQLGDGSRETVTSTGEHPFHVQAVRDFVSARDLKVGDLVTLAFGEARVECISTRLVSPAAPVPTYNFEVEECHTYFVGKIACWVHNKASFRCDSAANAISDVMRQGGDVSSEVKQQLTILEHALDSQQITQKAYSKAVQSIQDVAKYDDAALRKIEAEVKTKLGKPITATLEDCRRPLPNTLYESNGYFYRTDADKHLIEVSGDLRLNKANRNAHQQRNIGNSSGSDYDDDGGHMIGAQFDGLGEGALHMVPQAMQLNRGKGSLWRAMETEWKNALEGGGKVSVKINIDWPSGAPRPSKFIVDYEIVDASGVMESISKNFKNI